MSDDPFGNYPQNPYAATSTLETQASPNAVTGRSYGGIGRMAYFGYTFLAGMVYNVLVLGIGAAQLGESAALAVIPLLLAYFGVLFWIVAQRMINTGYSPWWCVGIIVPLLNILVGIRCLACPEGFADHQTLDTAGKVIVGLFLGLFALVVLAVVVAVVAGS